MQRKLYIIGCIEKKYTLKDLYLVEEAIKYRVKNKQSNFWEPMFYYFLRNQFIMFVNTVFPITADITESTIEKQEEKHNILKYLYEIKGNQNYGGTLLGALNATTYYDSHRDEMYFKKSVVTDEAFFRQLDGKQLPNKLLKFAL